MSQPIIAYLRHELRTPLNALVGYSELLLEETADDWEALQNLRADLQVIHSASIQLTARVNSLLDPVSSAATQADTTSQVFSSYLQHALVAPIQEILATCETALRNAQPAGEEGLIPDLEKMHTAANQFLAILTERAGSLPEITQASLPATQEVKEKSTPKERDGQGGHVLIVDDNELNCDVLSRLLESQGHQASQASNGRLALEALATTDVDLLLLDIMMPEMDGYQMLERIKADPGLRDIPVIIISSLGEIDSVVRCIELGAEDYLLKPFNAVLLRARIETCLEKKHLRDLEKAHRREIEESNRQLENRVHQQVEQIRETFDQLHRALEGTILALSSALERRDPYTAGHQQRVSQLACAIARHLTLPDSQVDGIRVAGILHDIGKISIPFEILNKPGQLTEVEFNLIKIHAQASFDILRSVEFPWPVAQIVLQHHEKMDGSGYPHGLSGTDILLEARILCVADVVEAMSSHRPYRPALGVDKALEEISRRRGIAYDSEVAEACLKLFQGEDPNFCFQP